MTFDPDNTYAKRAGRALRRKQRSAERTPGTIEVSEANYRRLVDERRALLAVLKEAHGMINPHAPHSAGCLDRIREALKLAEGD